MFQKYFLICSIYLLFLLLWKINVVYFIIYFSKLFITMVFYYGVAVAISIISSLLQKKTIEVITCPSSYDKLKTHIYWLNILSLSESQISTATNMYNRLTTGNDYISIAVTPITQEALTPIQPVLRATNVWTEIRKP